MQRSEPHYVYYLIDPRDNGIKYIGCSVDPRSRFYSHLGEKIGLKQDWISELKKMNLRPWLLVPIKCDNRDEGLLLESFLINEMKPIFNTRGIIENEEKNNNIKRGFIKRNIEFDKELYREIKILTAQEGGTSQDMIFELINIGIETKKKQS